MNQAFLTVATDSISMVVKVLSFEIKMFYNLPDLHLLEDTVFLNQQVTMLSTNHISCVLNGILSNIKCTTSASYPLK